MQVESSLTDTKANMGVWLGKSILMLLISFVGCFAGEIVAYVLRLPSVPKNGVEFLLSALFRTVISGAVIGLVVSLATTPIVRKNLRQGDSLIKYVAISCVGAIVGVVFLEAWALGVYLGLLVGDLAILSALALSIVAGVVVGVLQFMLFEPRPVVGLSWIVASALGWFIFRSLILLLIGGFLLPDSMLQQ